MRDRLTLSMRASHVLALVFALGALGLAGFGAATGDTFYLRLGTEALIFAGLALSVDLLLGYCGALSLGQALYFGIGAYVSAFVLLRVPSFWLAMLAAAGATLLASVIGGLIANRVRGVYFALITFGLAQVVAKVIYNTRELGASDGMIGIPVVQIGFGPFSVSAGNPVGFFLVVLAIIMGLYAITAYLLDTPFGRVLTALKANEKRVPYLGYSVWRARMFSYVLAGLIAGLSGALYPMLRGFVSPELLFFATSGNAVISVILGGVGTLVGALYGSVLLVVLKSIIGSWTEHHLIVIGLLFMICVMFLPKGLAGFIRPLIEARLAGRPIEEPPLASPPTRAGERKTMTNPVLDIRDLGIAFGGLKAVDGVSFKAERHRITTVIGPNGAGKSTLFNLISGALKPKSGHVVIDGVDMTGASPARTKAAGLSRSFQITNLFFELTVAENLRMAAQVLEPAGRAFLPIGRSLRARAKVDEMLERFQLGRRRDELAGNLSHGDQRRLEIAVCLASQPKILLLDEPTQGMSHGDTADTAQLVRSLARDVTVLLIEHDIGLVMDLSDHVVVMHQGRKLAEGPPAAVRADPAVQAAYFGHH